MPDLKVWMETFDESVSLAIGIQQVVKSSEKSHLCLDSSHLQDKKTDALWQIWSKDEDEENNNNNIASAHDALISTLSFIFRSLRSFACFSIRTRNKMWLVTIDWEENKTSIDTGKDVVRSLLSIRRDAVALFEKPQWRKGKENSTEPPFTREKERGEKRQREK